MRQLESYFASKEVSFQRLPKNLIHIYLP